MALISKRPFKDVFLPLDPTDSSRVAHVLEPEYHQDLYRGACETAKDAPLGSFQIAEAGILVREPNRGKQPEYVDDLDEPESLHYIGMSKPNGDRETADETTNVAALKSVAIRTGYVDIDSARSVSETYFEKNKDRSSVVRGDVLINSTGDGTIGRVAVYHYDFPAVVDGHVTILRFGELELAWYVAAYLLTEQGQHQIYRYINGSSGQVEIYPQDIGRLWVPKQSDGVRKDTAAALESACQQFERFRSQMSVALALASS